LGACRQAIKLRRNHGKEATSSKIQVLDPLSGRGWPAIWKAVLSRWGFKVEEASFFTGDLKMADGQSVYIAARSLANDIAFRSAEKMVDQSPFLRRLNNEWGSNIILLHLAKSMWFPANLMILRLLVASTLAQDFGETAPFIVQYPSEFEPSFLFKLVPKLKVHFYRTYRKKFNRHQVFIVLWLLRHTFRKMKWRLESIAGKTRELIDTKPDRPSLMLLQEDDISLDRSYRTQPHWLFPDYVPPFRTLILQTSSLYKLLSQPQELQKQSVFFLSFRDWSLALRGQRILPVQQRLQKDLRNCLVHMLLGKSPEIFACTALIQLLKIAAELAVFCQRFNVKAFMTCENYIKHTDAMQLIAPSLDIRTLSYQYSNMYAVAPIMMTTADIMVTFSKMYQRRWTYKGCAPKEFVNAGYLFSGSFKYLQERAIRWRSQLTKAGANFIISYFDENVQTDKYGCIKDEDHMSEIFELLKLVIEDPSFGLIIKSQFKRNSPRFFDKITGERAKAEATGRYMELVYGSHRNIIFPAEAALSSDMVIGHTVGATAGLEAAVAGVRCILLNPYGIKGDNDALYAQADIVYPSLGAALEAIHDYRRGMPRSAHLGDWSPIIDHFDPFRDGLSGHRLRTLLEQAVLRGPDLKAEKFVGPKK
jgi:hypothetical protein